MSTHVCVSASAVGAAQLRLTPLLMPPAQPNTCIARPGCVWQVCKPRDPNRLSAWHIGLIGLAAVLLLCLLVMLTSLTLSMCIARTGKVRRQIQW